LITFASTAASRFKIAGMGKRLAESFARADVQIWRGQVLREVIDLILARQEIESSSTKAAM
jgi:hypothetical protein